MKTRDVPSSIKDFLPSQPVFRQEHAGARGCRELALGRLVARAALSLVPSLCLASLLASAADDTVLNPSTTTRGATGFQAGATVALSPAAGVVGSGNPATNVVPALPGRNMDALDDKQKLGVGDRVSFRVIEDQEAPKALTITDAGDLDVPELGLVTAAGKTCKQLAFDIKPKLEETTYYHATVIIGIDLLNKTMSGRRVYVAGQVLRAGPQEIPAGETWTVTKAIMRAGGFTHYADQKKVRLVRPGAKGEPGRTFILNAAEVWEKGRTELDLSVEPEDLIYVPARAVNLFN